MNEGQFTLPHKLFSILPFFHGHLLLCRLRELVSCIIAQVPASDAVDSAFQNQLWLLLFQVAPMVPGCEALSFTLNGLHKHVQTTSSLVRSADVWPTPALVLSAVLSHSRHTEPDSQLLDSVQQWLRRPTDIHWQGVVDLVAKPQWSNVAELTLLTDSVRRGYFWATGLWSPPGSTAFHDSKVAQELQVAMRQAALDLVFRAVATSLDQGEKKLRFACIPLPQPWTPPADPWMRGEMEWFMAHASDAKYAIVSLKRTGRDYTMYIVQTGSLHSEGEGRSAEDPGKSEPRQAVPPIAATAAEMPSSSPSVSSPMPPPPRPAEPVQRYHDFAEVVDRLKNLVA